MNNEARYNETEYNRQGTINNFKYFFEALSNTAWGVVMAGNKKERIDFYNDRYEKVNEEMKTEIIDMIDRYFDLVQAVDSMPEEVSKEISDKWCEMQRNRRNESK